MAGSFYDTPQGELFSENELSEKSDLPKGFDVEPIFTEALPTIKVIRKSPTQFNKALDTDAAYDITAAISCVIPAWQKLLVPTDLFIKIPDGYRGILKSRSGLSVKHDIEIGAGVIDPDYIGEIKVVMRNLSDTDYKVTEGDKIAQMKLELNPEFNIQEVTTLKDTKRGTRGFNSTGY